MLMPRRAALDSTGSAALPFVIFFVALPGVMSSA
jgi:hypothetical protein